MARFSSLALVVLSLAAERAAVADQTSSAGAEANACIPDCRKGYVCARGACVSRCNPPCGAGEACTEAGECVASAPPPPPPVAPPSATPATKEPARRGFFARLAPGLAYASHSVSSSGFSAGGDLTFSSVTYSAFAPIGELSIGGTPARGIVVGGTALGTHASLSASDGTAGRNFTYVLLGPFIEYFFADRAGAHIGAVVGDVVREHGSQVGFSFVAGYDLALSEVWSVGLVGRASVSPASDSNSALVVPSLSLSATYH